MHFVLFVKLFASLDSSIAMRVRRNKVASVELANEYEQGLLKEVVFPEDINVGFDAIGGLDEVLCPLYATPTEAWHVLCGLS